MAARIHKTLACCRLVFSLTVQKLLRAERATETRFDILTQSKAPDGLSLCFVLNPLTKFYLNCLGGARVNRVVVLFRLNPIVSANKRGDKKSGQAQYQNNERRKQQYVL